MDEEDMMIGVGMEKSRDGSEMFDIRQVSFQVSSI